MDVGVGEGADAVGDGFLVGFVGGVRGRGTRRGHAGGITVSPYQMTVRNVSVQTLA